MNDQKNVILEPSTNTHVMKSDGVISCKKLENGILVLELENGKGIVTHGEHKVIATESKNVVKYVQQELNPVTKMLQNAYD